ncbi:hypothetical protein JW711_00695 [Candidatus Woesearchaeota archaeon]|nr:hypothetical protein [Candidatus Woesearchaeota archaeon]
MTDLVACLGAGKGTWTGVLRLASRSEFENVFLVMSEWTRQNLKLEKQNVHSIVVNSDTNTSTSMLRDSIVSQLKGRVKGMEVAVNIDSGTGREHTAVMTSLMRLGLSFRFVAWENEKIEEVSYDLHVPSEDQHKY